ncbi:hypothetical protein A2U01_0079099 [Trifolium medium]|uniref:Uncharacterized protein n=1 Tax=Trifolium medium TaxID=97028 RepID=A0A392T9Y9_9FABA|nr:hypothetical protein [Trifolium medium]
MLVVMEMAKRPTGFDTVVVVVVVVRCCCGGHRG